MKILVTGNPSYEGLAKGIAQAMPDYNIDFIGRHNGWRMNDYDTIADKAVEYDVFVNSLYIPSEGQTVLLDKVYNKFEKGHIINISTTSVYWNNGSEKYLREKGSLEAYSKKLSNKSSWENSPIKVSCIAYGPLDSESQLDKPGKKISLKEAGSIVKFLVDQPAEINTHYICLDPIQKD
tara:strand:- start:280 stop:816 length:537 start_codon:yes stop_codon:yes gene_type:complete